MEKLMMLIVCLVCLPLLQEVRGQGVGDACAVEAPANRRLLVLGSCTGDLVCDTDDVCRLPAGGICSDPEGDECVSGTFCDEDSRCKIKAGRVCTVTDASFCLRNAVCSFTVDSGPNAVCICDECSPGSNDNMKCSGAATTVSLTLMALTWVLSRLF